ncbi:hypothetical protein AKJ58_00280 [candidate division MSBL1 archaeon SCGC-AAA385D11]|uniref:TNase-like domain-containing protein n=1 Tax=candidate division MSBL1 archaeon SCGC-AAA385D11 TaxID=1698286 RepID=A0A133VPG1_9EURY|nr:hypothetical protein AKJ58_00280 [candidate division MSBL1 archaeon SCGC-AAA385D11]
MVDDKLAVTIMIAMILAGGGKVLIQLVQHQQLKNGPEPERSEEILNNGPENDVVGEVVEVIDGDTINIIVTDVNGTKKGIWIGKEDTVRLAGGIDAPEFYENGYIKARDFLRSLLPQGSKIYLDLDDLAKSKTGRPYRDLTSSERLVAVVYVRVDNRWANINAEVLRWGQNVFPNRDWLAYTDIASEFNPYKWLEENHG